MFTRMILFCESEGIRTKLWYSDSTAASIHHALKHTFWADGHTFCQHDFEKDRPYPHPMLVFAWKSCRSRHCNIEQMTVKKADSPGVLSVYRCVIYDHHLWALDVALAPVLGSKRCSRILQTFLTSVFCIIRSCFYLLTQQIFLSWRLFAWHNLVRFCWKLARLREMVLFSAVVFLVLGFFWWKKRGLKNWKPLRGKPEQRKKWKNMGRKGTYSKLRSKLGTEIVHGNEFRSS